MNDIKTKMYKISIIIIIFFLFGSDIHADQQIGNQYPQFQDYPVKEQFKGKNAPIKLTPESRVFETRLRKAAKEKPNFAGHYILSTWGCGMECVMGGVIDAKTGNVYPLPFSICCWGSEYDDNFEPIDFRKDSNLVVFTGARNMAESDAGNHYYIFDGEKFVHLMSRIGDLPKREIPKEHK